MKNNRNGILSIINFILNHRILISLVLAIMTIFLCIKLPGLSIDVNPEAMFPTAHPYFKIAKDYEKMTAPPNALMCLIEVKKGNIYTIETIKKIEHISNSLRTIDGIDASKVQSLTEPSTKDVVVSAWGIQMEPIVNELPRNQADLDHLKLRVNAGLGISGRFVSYDGKAAAIFAEVLPGLDHKIFNKQLMDIKAKESNDLYEIYFTGVPYMETIISKMTIQIGMVLGITFLCIIVLLGFFFRTWYGVLFPLLSFIICILWGFGFAAVLGIKLSPLMILIHILISVTALTHTVNAIHRLHFEYRRLGNYDAALKTMGTKLFPQGTASVVVVGLTLLALTVVTIPLIRDVAFFAAIWTIAVFASVKIFSLILLSTITPPDRIKNNTDSLLDRLSNKILHVIGTLSVKNPGRPIVIFIVLLALVAGGAFAARVKVGDIFPGAAMLFPENPWNKGFNLFTEKFIGANHLVIYVDSKEDEGIKDEASLRLIDEFQAYMEAETDAFFSLAFPTMIKAFNRMFHEGHPKWEIVPDSSKEIAMIAAQIFAGNPEAASFIDSKWNKAVLMVMYKDRDIDKIKKRIAKANAFIETHPSEKIRFRLAGGLLGILSATYPETERSYWLSIALASIATFIVFLITFRSFTAGIILIIPLGIAQVFAWCFMVYKGIYISVNTLVVPTVGIGVAATYGIYIMARILEEYKQMFRENAKIDDQVQINGIEKPKAVNRQEEWRNKYDEAITLAIKDKGKLILFMGSIHFIVMILWAFIDLKFFAHMGLLMGLLMILSMFAALSVIPSLASMLKPGFAAGKEEM